MGVNERYTGLLRNWFKKYLIDFLIGTRFMNLVLSILIAIFILLLKGNIYFFKFKNIVEVNLINIGFNYIIVFTFGMIISLVVNIAYIEDAFNELCNMISEYGTLDENDWVKK